MVFCSSSEFFNLRIIAFFNLVHICINFLCYFTFMSFRYENVFDAEMLNGLAESRSTGVEVSPLHIHICNCSGDGS